MQGVELLVKGIKTNFNVSSYLRMEKGQPTIYIPKKEVPVLAKAISPSMHPSTYYKLGLDR